MFSILAIALLFTAVSAGPPAWHGHPGGGHHHPFQGPKFDAFQVTFGPRGSGRGYNDMPWTVQEATASKQWEKIGQDSKLNVDIYSQHGDPRVMLLFDKRKNIAGIRMAFLKKDVTKRADEGGYKFEFDYENNPMYEAGNYWGLDLYHVTVLFVSPSKLVGGGRPVVLNKARGDPVAEGVFFKADGKWTEMSTDECRPSPRFSKLRCTPGMGMHYYYKMDDERDCPLRQPFFVLYDQGKLNGFGIAGFGPYTKDPKTKNYYDEYDVVPGSPNVYARGIKCYEDYSVRFGFTLMHVYLKKGASELTCPAQDWSTANC